tara:strand:+ start:499 stop:690 length:192 start_codon:yes stop_codon:yes gene_type:complete
MPKPIEEIHDTLKEMLEELKVLKHEINHIKEYVRKEEVRKSLQADMDRKIDKSYEHVSYYGWW